MTRRFRVKPGGWFLVGTVAALVADCDEAGLLLLGWRRSEGEPSEGHPRGELYWDEELCARDEVEEIHGGD